MDSVVASQTVDALDIEQIVFFHFSQQRLILRTIKVLTRTFFRVNIFLRYTCLTQSEDLAILVLLFGRDTDIAIDSRIDTISHPSDYAAKFYIAEHPHLHLNKLRFSMP